MNKKKLILIGGMIALLIISFVAGMEYKAYQVRQAINEELETLEESLEELDNIDWGIEEE